MGKFFLDDVKQKIVRIFNNKKINKKNCSNKSKFDSKLKKRPQLKSEMIIFKYSYAN